MSAAVTFMVFAAGAATGAALALMITGHRWNVAQEEQ